MNEEKQVPYKEVHVFVCENWQKNIFFNSAKFPNSSTMQIANKLKDEYLQQMELYKRKKDEVILRTK